MRHRHDEKLGGREAQYRQPPEKRNRAEGGIPRIAYAQRQVEILTGVVHQMYRPQQARFVMEVMQAIKAKIPSDEGEQPLRPHRQAVHHMHVGIVKHQAIHPQFHAAKQPQQHMARIEVEHHVCPRCSLALDPLDVGQFGHHHDEHQQ